MEHSPTHPRAVSLWPFSDPAPLTEPLITDRPDFTESPETIPRGHVQLEMGYTFTYDRENQERTRDHTVPELLIRVGLVDDLELRLAWQGYSYTDALFQDETPRGRTVSREDWSQGNNDLSIGFKYHIADQRGWTPALGVIAAINVPTGSDGLSSGDVEPAVTLAWAYDLNDWWSLAGNVGLAVPSEAGRQFLQSSASLTTGFAITDRLATYVEYFGFYPDANATDAAHTLNAGLTILITDDLQIDLRAGFGINEQADDFFTGMGLSWRF